MDTCAWPKVVLVCLLVLLAQTALGQTPASTEMEFDCRRPGVSCGDPPNDDLCMPDGKCNCSSSGLEGYDCRLNATTRAATPCASCLNKATCLTDGSCYCPAGYYGKWCENKRAELWCNGQEMTINIFPIGSDDYHIFVTAQGKDNSEIAACSLTKGISSTFTSELLPLKKPPKLRFNISSAANYNSIPYVKNKTDNKVPELQGYIITLNHTDDSTNTSCGAANISEPVNGSRTDYIRKVVLEYNVDIISSLDHLITLNCSIQNFTSFTATSDTAVSIVEEDYTPVDVVTTFQPVIFEVMDAGNKPLSTSVALGQDIKLVFTLADNSNYTSFKVASCITTNGNTNTSLKFTLIENDCPTSQSKLVSLGEVQRSSVTGESGPLKKVTIPLKAFKFKGTSDQVIFSCTLTMCRDGDNTACSERSCGTTPAVETSSTTTTTTTTESTTTTQQTSEATTTSPATSPESPAARRKRSASQQDQQEVSSTIRVTSSSGSSSPSVSGQDSQIVPEEECMDRTQVITIIVVFSIIVLLLLVVVVALVVWIYRSRLRIASKIGFADSTSLYTLPRLTVAHDKPA